MSLLTRRTDLKSLKYGNDTPGGGNSGQPYQQVDINTADSGFNRFRMTKFDDGLVRGGVVGAANASIVDTFRIGKFLKDFPKGPLFIVKQVGLQLSNPQIEHKTNFPTNRPTREQGLLRNVGNFVSNTANKILNAVGPTRIYNLGINTLAQVPVNAFGQHIVRHGFTPRRDDDNLYFKVARHNNNESNNRLSQLRSIIGNTNDIANYIGGPSSVYGIGNTIIRRRGDFRQIEQDITANSWATSGSFALSRDNQLNSFISASNGIRDRKFLGLSYKFMSSLAENKFEEDGEAIVRREENQPISLRDNNWTNYKDKNKEAIAYSNASSKMRDEPNSFTGVSQYSSSIFSTIRFDNLTSTTGDLYKPQTLNDYTASLLDLVESVGKKENFKADEFDLGLSLETSGDLNDISVDINTINEGLNQNVIKYSNPTLKTYFELRNKVDEVNNFYKRADITLKNKKGIEIKNTLEDIFERTGPGESDENVDNDAMALKFVPLDPFTGQPLPSTYGLNFLGYLNEFTENYTSNWGDVKYVGRSEKFYIFNEFTRDVQVGFNIPCFNSKELEIKHCQLSELASTLAGKYQEPNSETNSGALLGGIITRLKLGNYVNDQPGIIKNLTFAPIQDSSWDLDKKLAFYIKVTFGFTVIHNFLPQYYPCGFIFKEPDPIPQKREERPTTSTTTTTTTAGSGGGGGRRNIDLPDLNPPRLRAAADNTRVAPPVIIDPYLKAKQRFKERGLGGGDFGGGGAGTSF
jgi:hypothetical protein